MTRFLSRKAENKCSLWELFPCPYLIYGSTVCCKGRIYKLPVRAAILRSVNVSWSCSADDWLLSRSNGQWMSLYPRAPPPLGVLAVSGREWDTGLVAFLGSCQEWLVVSPIMNAGIPWTSPRDRPSYGPLGFPLHYQFHFPQPWQRPVSHFCRCTAVLSWK